VTDFDASDIHAMRKQGDLRDFLRGQMRAGKPSTAKPAPPQPPGHVPGAWPAGCQRPERPPPQPREAWMAALAEFRAYEAFGQPPGQYRCECGCTPPDDDTPRST
jgi:hypothetical protein